MFGKLINNTIIFSPRTIVFDNGSIICNPNSEQLFENGYKKIEYSEKQIIKDDEYLIELYDEYDDKIIVNYKIEVL